MRQMVLGTSRCRMIASIKEEAQERLNCEI